MARSESHKITRRSSGFPFNSLFLKIRPLEYQQMQELERESYGTKGHIAYFVDICKLYLRALLWLFV